MFSWLRALCVAWSVASCQGLALKTNARLTRGVPKGRWSFEVFRREPTTAPTPGDPVPDVELVARDGKGEVGWFELFRVKADAPEEQFHAKLRDAPDADHAFGKNMFVDTSARREGVASRLLEAAEEVVAGWNLSEMIVTAVKSHEPSRALYRKLGFEEVAADLADDSESVVLRKFVRTATKTEG